MVCFRKISELEKLSKLETTRQGMPKEDMG